MVLHLLRPVRLPARGRLVRREPGGRHVRQPVLRTLAVVGVLAAVGLGAGVTAAPAQAHPFGDPQTVAISLDSGRADVVRVRWKVGGLDDLTLLGVALGVLPQSRVMLDGAAFFEPADAMAVGPSAKFSAYLLRQIKVRANGHECAGVVEPPKELAKTGVAVAFTCPEPIAKADITVRMLTDLNPAYRTLATGPNGDRTVYSTDKDTYDWSFGSGTAVTQKRAGRSAAIQLSVVVGGVVLVAAVGLVVIRRVRAQRQEVAV
ncbi:hypothetical protein [Kribbella ginsengisoli]|uniref:hypothetical protein n=1 Tax=Kribbella ginsengisoli TaxID=363865 RepID=UPI0031D8E5E9